MTIRKIKNLVLLTLLLTAPSAWAETIDCTAITTLPYVITTQGIYCFTGNLATSMSLGRAIDIQTNNVTIDLNGWKLGGLAAGTGTGTTGIYAYQRKNITIKNGIIRGFFNGIWLHDATPYTTSQGHLIEDIRADQNTFSGIEVRGRGNTVRRNQVVDTGGSTTATSAYGIRLLGPGVRALNNDISSTAATGGGESNGLSIRDADGAVVQNNRIADVSSVTGDANGMKIHLSNNIGIEGNHIADVSSSSGGATGILFNLSNDITAEYNRIHSVVNNSGPATVAIYFRNSDESLAGGNRMTSTYFGILYDNSAGKYMDNLTRNVSVTFIGGTPVGTNN